MLRPMSMRLTVVLATGLALMTGCTSEGHPTAGRTPMPVASVQVTCQAALPGRDVSSEQATTVAEVRSTVGGPGVRLFSSAFPAAPGTQSAAWCWVRMSSTTYVSYAVSGAVALKGPSISGMSQTPKGQPLIP